MDTKFLHNYGINNTCRSVPVIQWSLICDSIGISPIPFCPNEIAICNSNSQLSNQNCCKTCKPFTMVGHVLRSSWICKCLSSIHNWTYHSIWYLLHCSKSPIYLLKSLQAHGFPYSWMKKYVLALLLEPASSYKICCIPWLDMDHYNIHFPNVPTHDKYYTENCSWKLTPTCWTPYALHVNISS